ncbi:hypothetical protein H5T87_00090 [bacterium]|nr:hypothetical protein [bacterium]
MVFSPRQRKLRIISIILSLVVVLLLFIGWRFSRPEWGKYYILFWGICFILALILILLALEEMKEISRYYIEKRREIIRRDLSRDDKRKG